MAKTLDEKVRSRDAQLARAVIVGKIDAALVSDRIWHVWSRSDLSRAAKFRPRNGRWRLMPKGEHGKGVDALVGALNG